MPNPNFSTSYQKKEYDSRWFIWTVVFLVITGISLVSYILLSDTTGTDASNLLTTSKMVRHK